MVHHLIRLDRSVVISLSNARDPTFPQTFAPFIASTCLVITIHQILFKGTPLWL